MFLCILFIGASMSNKAVVGHIKGHHSNNTPTFQRNVVSILVAVAATFPGANKVITDE